MFLHRIQQLTLKESQYINWHLPIPNFPMSFISMDLVGPYRETENGNQYALTVICMLTTYIFMIPIRSKSTEDIIKAYLTGAYSTFGGSKYILSDCSSEFTSKQLDFLPKELGFIKICTSPYIPTGNSIIEHTHSFLKASIRKLMQSSLKWDKTVHIATMAYNVSPTPDLENPHFTLCLDVTPTLFK